jgi:aryl-alcohol dehydrogenase-like predicted oxidoreductase
MVLAYGALTGRGRTGRARELPDRPGPQRAFEVGDQLRFLAAELDTTPAQLAIAFALANPRVATALFGASKPEQIRENVGAVEVVARLTDAELEDLRALSAPA